MEFRMISNALPAANMANVLAAFTIGHAAGFPLVPEILPQAAAVARLAACRLANGAGSDPALVAPLYVRDKVAKTIRERLDAGGKA